ncbi:hypothetical protein [Staphylococcus felis]|uniref:hypothetical protein n=1 Tax=Staphylococcus felis TaxID=46127 RepID=UPI000CD099E9|nr:hypothetical protein [Staphylococcus felis]AVP37466.1 hypothetical protein C7J90_11050 [Staphylococcus felis]PNZ36226.1 hypothetical protein CD143_04470 [Staphylococcus felis]QQB02584.1 hypothetical protein I6H71_07450 [Staphylococcus felis]
MLNQNLILKLTNYVKFLGIKDTDIAQTIAHDVLLDPSAKGREYKAAKFRTLKFFSDDRKEYRNLATWQSISPTSLNSKTKNDLEGDESMLIDVIPYDDYNEKASAKLSNQRQLIIGLLDGADERTTAIVQSWLECDKPSYALVGRILGLSSKTVERSIKRLKRNYTFEQFGDYRECLSA